MKVKLTNVRLAFPVLFVAKAFGEGEGKAEFSASFLMDPASQAALVKAVDAGADEVAKAKWGAKAAGNMALIRKTDKLCMHDGNLKAQYAGFEGTMYVSARNEMRPVVVNKDTSPLTAQDGVVYAGCYVNATVELWAQDNKYGKRVNATLLGVQFVRDGDRFSGGSVGSADDFDDLGDGADTEEGASENMF